VPEVDWPYRQSIPIRYHECDMQQVVFNSHYLMFCDLAMTAWMAAHGVTLSQIDWMLVKAGIEWQSSATFRDVLDVDVGVLRWGNKSFDVAFRGTVADRPVFTAEITYVCVAPGTTDSVRIPDDVRDELGPVPT
jgi:acyl-CoA thioester hydrolase